MVGKNFERSTNGFQPEICSSIRLRILIYSVNGLHVLLIWPGLIKQKDKPNPTIPYPQMKHKIKNVPILPKNCHHEVINEWTDSGHVMSTGERIYASMHTCMYVLEHYTPVIHVIRHSHVV